MNPWLPQPQPPHDFTVRATMHTNNRDSHVTYHCKTRGEAKRCCAVVLDFACVTSATIEEHGS
jgi:hypothetical protein